MRLRSRIGVLAFSGLAALALITGTSVMPAHASGGAICAQSGTGFCMNNWNGAGGAIKMGQQGWPNQSFSAVQLTTMCGHGTVTGTCPFSNLALDSILFGEPIVKVAYSTGGCLGLSNSGGSSGFMETCPGANGTGGGWGTVMVEDFGCNVHLDDVRATDNGGTSTPFNWRSPGVVGGQVVTTTNRDGGSCWG